ncbi:protein phosphatase 1 regulatory subunit 7-like [Liolophura sinensis]|uniref:protein phosphatase 1 regulatory subunit 7-like n=1 Tax=Liolophura sinensis TaxID=3198878 RepID=UPI0031597265
MMNAKVKSVLNSSVPSSLGQPVGVFPVMRPDRPPVPLSRATKISATRDGSGKETHHGHRKHTSATSRRRDTSQDRQKRGRSIDRIRALPGVSQKTQLRRDESYDGSDIGQDVRFINISDDDGASSRLSDGKDERRRLQMINPEQLLKESQESDYNKVYEVNLHACEIGQINFLDQFKKLRVLDLSCNEIEKIEKLENNQDLRELKLYDNKIKTIENLDRLKDLCHLQLQHNKIRTVGKGLGYLKKLKILRLDNNQLLKIEPSELAGSSQVTTLDVSSNKLDSLTALNSLPNLEELYATNNRLKALSDLGRCRKLQEVDLSCNRLTDLSGLKGLPHLQILNVSSNHLTSLKEVGKLKCLQELSLSDNKFDNVSSFTDQFPNLEILNISNNKLQDLDNVIVLKDLLSLVELYVSGNPCTDQAGGGHPDIHTALPQLEILDGVTLKKWSGTSSAPLMRPMSASSVVSVRYVENQMKTLSDELQSFEQSFANRFELLKTVYDSLPSESPSRAASRQEDQLENDRPSTSRCSSRSKIKLAMEFAASQQF